MGVDALPECSDVSGSSWKDAIGQKGPCRPVEVGSDGNLA